jgi:predicted ATP-dependent serine protease
MEAGAAHPISVSDCTHSNQWDGLDENRNLQSKDQKTNTPYRAYIWARGESRRVFRLKCLHSDMYKNTQTTGHS